MPSFIIIEDKNNKSLSIRYDTTQCEVSVSELKDFFSINPEHEISILEVGNEDVSLAVPQQELEDNIQGFKLGGLGSAKQYRIIEVTKKNVPGSHSIIDHICLLPLNSSLHVAFSSVEEILLVEELPTSYNGYTLFELPPSTNGSMMQGMEQRHDGHAWTRYCTCTNGWLNGTVKLSKCSGHLRCYNLECPYRERCGNVNETHWKGRLSTPPSIGPLTQDSSTLVCKHCLEPPECIALCDAIIYYCACIATDTTRCAIHVGVHNHPVANGLLRASEHHIDSVVAERARMNMYASPKNIEVSVTRDIVMEMFLNAEGAPPKDCSEENMHLMLEKITPLCQRRRLQRCIQTVKKDQMMGEGGLDSILELKRRCCYPFIHSVLFPNQLDDIEQPHIFKMLLVGPGSGIDLINRMRPGGSLEKQWLHFDHIHRVKGWCTMGAHVYDPFVRELLTIATAEFKVQNHHAQIQFWKLLNAEVIKLGFPTPEFRGFMSDEAQSNWIAVRTVYNNGPDNVMHGRERSCIFHWEMSMVEHTRRGVKPQFQEEHKALCRKWRMATSDGEADSLKKDIYDFWTWNHIIVGELESLQLWIEWWDTRAFHWGARFLTHDGKMGFVPSTNLSESKHSSMRAAHGAGKYVNLFEATAIDLSLAILQCAHYKSYLDGRHFGTGPSLKNFADTMMSDGSRKRSGQQVVDLTDCAMKEVGLGSSEYTRPYTEQYSIRRKRESGKGNIIFETDSHRPEFSTITANKVIGERPKVPLVTVGESQVHDANWAIRRTPSKSEVTCFGLLQEGSRCGKLINQLGKNAIVGVPAPCFLARRSYPGGVQLQNIWFCNDTVTHTWRVHASVIGRPGDAPGVWKVAHGTNLTFGEQEQLQFAGFVFETGQCIENPSATAGTIPPLSNLRPGRRDGKVVRWKSKPSQKFKEWAKKGRMLIAEVVRENVIIENELHVFNLKTQGSEDAGIVYSVTIGEFPRCTCPDFMQREADQRAGYMPCKHIYFIFLKFLGLKEELHMLIHQAALTKVELFQALHGRVQQ